MACIDCESIENNIHFILQKYILNKDQTDKFKLKSLAQYSEKELLDNMSKLSIN